MTCKTMVCRVLPLAPSFYLHTSTRSSDRSSSLIFNRSPAPLSFSRPSFLCLVRSLFALFLCVSLCSPVLAVTSLFGIFNTARTLLPFLCLVRSLLPSRALTVIQHLFKDFKQPALPRDSVSVYLLLCLPVPGLTSPSHISNSTRFLRVHSILFLSRSLRCVRLCPA